MPENRYLVVKGGGRRLVLYEYQPIKKYFVNFFGEFLGTWVLVFMGCLSAATHEIRPPDKKEHSEHIQVTLSFGLGVMVAVQCFSHLSGSHINPPVSLGSFILGYLSLTNVPLYIIAQMLGAMAAHGSVLMLMPNNFTEIVRANNKNMRGGERGYGPCSPAMMAGLEAWQGFVCEFFLMAMLMMICGAVWDWRHKDHHDSVPVRFGLGVGVIAMAGGAVSGANFNPARTFGPCLFNGDWENQWIYWAGPFLGGILASLLYRFLFAEPDPNAPPPADA